MTYFVKWREYILKVATSSMDNFCPISCSSCTLILDLALLIYFFLYRAKSDKRQASNLGLAAQVCVFFFQITF